MNRKLLLVPVLAVTLLVIWGLTNVSAYRGDYSKQGPNHTEERETSMNKVMEERDYEGWKELMTEDGRNPGVLRKVDSQEDFDKFAQAYELGHEGRTEEANAIREELSLGNGERRGNGGNHGQNRGGNFVDANNDGVCDRTE